MKSFILSFLGLFCVAMMSAQETETTTNKKLSPQQIVDSTAKAELKLKLTAIENLIDTIQKNKGDIKLLEISLKKTKLSAVEKAEKEADLKKLKESVIGQDTVILSKCSEFTKHRDYLKEFGKIDSEILKEFTDRSCRLYGPAPEKEIDYTKFIIIGDNEPITAESLFSNDNTKKALADVFSIKSETDLGTFEIPGNETYIKFYAQQKNTEEMFDTETENSDYVSMIRIKENPPTDGKEEKSGKEKDENQSKINHDLVPDGALFKSIQIELLEGGIVDARLILLSQDRKTQFYFEGRSPVSILNYTRKTAKRNFLEYSHHVDTGSEKVYYNLKAMKHLRIKYIDVLDYHPNVGSNYVPDDISYTFPSNKEEEIAITKRRSYQVINNNNLQHVLDIRTYTDFLGLFGDEANGLFQLEAKADFFVNPFNFTGSAFYYLKKVSPYVRYSRFDENEDFVPASLNTGTSEYEFSNKKLELLERSTLEMGLDINLINFRLFKESPFWTSLYIPFSYNVTNVQTDPMIDKINFKTLGYGIGAEIDLKRFNNFGLTLGYELKGYSFIGDYSEESLREPGYLKTQAVKAEIFYFPGSDRSQSVFLRMKSIRDVSSGNADSFFQLQVGYRFTLGVGAVKSK